MQNKRASYLGQRNFAALVVYNSWLRGFPLSAIANLFEFLIQHNTKVLMAHKTVTKTTKGVVMKNGTEWGGRDFKICRNIM